MNGGRAAQGFRDSNQFEELLDRKPGIPEDGAQEGFLDRLSWVYRDDCSRPRRGLDQDQMASVLPVFDEASTLERADDSSSG